MTTWVALLRAVNLGRNRKVPMARLRELCTEAGFEQVRTYVASGNVVARSRHRAEATVRAELERLLLEGFGFPVEVMARTGPQLHQVVERLPFETSDRVSVTFLQEPMPPATVEALQAGLLNDAALVADGRHAYLRTPEGLGQPYLSGPAAGALAAGTNRTWRTVLRLAEMADEVDARAG